MLMVELLLWASVAQACLLLYSLGRPPQPAKRALQLTLLIGLIWTLGYYLEMVLAGVEIKAALRIIRYIFTPWISVCWLYLLKELAGERIQIPAWVWKSSISFLLLNSLIAASSPWHQWMIYDFREVAFWGNSGYSYVQAQFGPWHGIYFAVNLGIICLYTMLLILRTLPKCQGHQRRSLQILFWGCFIPWAATLLFAVGIDLLPGLNLGPFLLSISVALLTVLIFRYRALDLIPVARYALLDSLPDKVLAINKQGRIFDLNQPVLDAIQKDSQALLGMRAEELPAPWNAAFTGDERLLNLQIADKVYWYDRDASVIKDARNRNVGTLIRLRDVTRQQNAEAKLRAQAHRENVLRCQQHLTRDLHDGLAGLLANMNLLAALGLKAQTPQAKDQHLRKLADFAQLANMEIHSMLNNLDSAEIRWSDIFEEMQRNADVLLTANGVRCTLHCEACHAQQHLAPTPAAAVSLLRIFREALRNIQAHAQASTATLTLQLSNNGMELTIADNGKGGLPPHFTGRGLKNMQQRITEMGGSLKAVDANGVTLKFHAPLPLSTCIDQSSPPSPSHEPLPR